MHSMLHDIHQLPEKLAGPDAGWVICLCAGVLQVHDIESVWGCSAQYDPITLHAYDHTIVILHGPFVDANWHVHC